VVECVDFSLRSAFHARLSSKESSILSMPNSLLACAFHFNSHFYSILNLNSAKTMFYMDTNSQALQAHTPGLYYSLW